MKKIILTFLFIMSFIGCRPEQEPTNFNVNVAPLAGPNMEMETDEDTAIKIDYALEGQDEAISLKLEIVQLPMYGSLSGCEDLGSTEMHCWYTPNKDFNGEDYILVQARDGDFTSPIVSKLTINVRAVADIPKIGANQEFSFTQNSTLNFSLSSAADPDTAQADIKYILVNGPANGTLNNCLGVNGAVNFKNCSYIPATNYYGADSISYYVEDQEGNRSLTNAVVSLNVGVVLMDGEEIFAQNNTSLKSVDITWVIDNSGSMSNEQATLQANFSSFIGKFLENGKARYPFKMAVTTTEAYISNREQFRIDPNTQNIYDLSHTAAESDFAAFNENFKEAVGVGVSGSGSEKALLSADSVFKSNPTWYGGNDTLSVYVLVTDEQEQSHVEQDRVTPILDENGDQYTIDRWAFEFQRLKDNPSKTRIFPIVRLNTDTDDRFKRIAELTGGTLSNIDAPFDGVLDSISAAIVNLLGSYLLDGNRDILANTIKVSIKLPNTTEYIETTEFTIESGSVKLNTAAPQFSSIKVNYKYQNIYTP
jgi:hypothetical protein